MLQDLIDDRIRNRLICFDNRDSHQRRCRAASVVWFLAPQCEVRDVDSASTEQTAEKADHTGNIFVFRVHQIAVKGRLARDTLNLQQPWFIEHNCTHGRKPSGFRFEFYTNGIHLGLTWFALLNDTEAALCRQWHGVDNVDSIFHRPAEHSSETGIP